MIFTYNVTGKRLVQVGSLEADNRHQKHGLAQRMSTIKTLESRVTSLQLDLQDSQSQVGPCLYLAPGGFEVLPECYQSTCKPHVEVLHCLLHMPLFEFGVSAVGSAGKAQKWGNSWGICCKHCNAIRSHRVWLPASMAGFHRETIL